MGAQQASEPVQRQTMEVRRPAPVLESSIAAPAGPRVGTGRPGLVAPGVQSKSDALAPLLRRVVAQRQLGEEQRPPAFAAGPRRATVARAITIGGERYTHGSRRVMALFSDVVAPALESHGYKARGIKARLVSFIRDTNGAYASNGAFLGAFLPWLATQTRAVRGGKTTPVLKPFSVIGMSRPAWPDPLRVTKGALAGDNVRHVVRNATLKRALDVEWNRLADGARKDRFTEIATGLGVAVGPHDAIDAIVSAIYRTVYLNPENLFAGDGPINQIIGFAADPVRQIGEDLFAHGDGEVDILDVYMKVMAAVHAASDHVAADWAYKKYVVFQIDDTVKEAIGSLCEDPSVNRSVSAEAAGELVTDIGLGFGFDLIDGRVAEDTDNIARRQGRLLWSERALDTFMSSGGATGNLLDILKIFMGSAEIPTL